MSKKILQLDVDPHPSSFDAVVAVDADVDHLLQYGNVECEAVESLVHGAMFTRGGDDLKNTALFIGGNDVVKAEAIFAASKRLSLAPVRVSVMLDASGCNTTAAAAVASASKHVSLNDCTAVVLGGTGPVGRRVAQMLARQNANVLLTSRSLNRAESACKEIGEQVSSGNLEATAPENQDDFKALLERADVIVASGAAGVELASKELIHSLSKLRVAIDLNAVPPAGLGGVEAFDKAKPLHEGQEDGPVAYGPIGVGGLKMRTHKAAIAKLFTSNSLVLDADEIYDLTIEQMNH